MVVDELGLVSCGEALLDWFDKKNAIRVKLL